MKKKKWLVGLLALACVTASAFALGGCNTGGDGETDRELTQIETIYDQYVIHAQANGETPLSYEEWLASIKGEKGDKGDKGEQGEIGATGKSAYEIWLDNGHTGTEEEFLLWLTGENHIHNFGGWVSFTTDAETPSENWLFIRTCDECNEIEWKQSTSDDHDWKDEYDYDNEYHWLECKTCGMATGKQAHTLDETDECSVCKGFFGTTAGVIFEVINGEASVVGYEGTENRVRIAETYEGVPVTTIGDWAFYWCGSLTSITVSENNEYYQSIDGNLYSKDGKTLIQYAIGKSTTTFEIPNSVTTIGGGAFAICYSLTSIVIPNSVTTIGDWAFGWCDSLTIYCEAESRPSGWDLEWNDSNQPVVWGYKGA